MKTLAQIAESYESQTLDGRDIYRLAQFIPFSELPKFGLSPKEGVTEEEWNSTVKEYNRENILAQLEEDVAFGFEKALNRRGISCSLMANVVMMWNWVLEEGLEDFDYFPLYGLPIFKATAVKYGFPNPIGNDSGSEDYYNEEDFWWF